MGGVVSGRIGYQLGMEGEVAYKRIDHCTVAIGLAGCHRLNFIHLPNLYVEILTLVTQIVTLYENKVITDVIT